MSPSAPTWHGPPGEPARKWCGFGGGRTVYRDLRSLDPRAQRHRHSLCLAWIFAKPGGGRAGTVGGAAVTHAQSESVPSARRRRGGSAEAQLADKRGRQHLELPGELFQQAGKDRYFEWQATPFLIASVYVVRRALRQLSLRRDIINLPCEEIACQHFAGLSHSRPLSLSTMSSQPSTTRSQAVT